MNRIMERSPPGPSPLVPRPHALDAIRGVEHLSDEELAALARAVLAELDARLSSRRMGLLAGAKAGAGPKPREKR